MATQVPYNPIPQVAARDEPTPYRSEAIPSGAFGQPQAQARIQEGQTLGQVGNELYARAIAVQEFNQQAEANEKDAAFQQQQIQAYTDYTQKMGKDAVDGLPGFMASQEAIRKQMGAGLSPYGQVLYNNQTRNAYNRMAFSAAVHAKDQQKQYVVAGFQAKRDAANNSLMANPDPSNLAPNMQAVEDAAREQGRIQKGFPDDSDQMKDYITEAKSSAVYSYVTGMVKSGKPLVADKVLEKFAADKMVTAQDYGKLKTYVQEHINSQQSRITASDIHAGVVGDWGSEKVGDLDRAGEAVAARESSNQWLGYHPAVPSGIHKGAHALGRYGIMDFNLSPWLKEAGMEDMTPDEFIADHAAQTKLFKFKFGQLQEETGSFDGALRKWFGPAASDGFTNWDKYVADVHGALARGAPPQEVERVARRVADQQQEGNPQYRDILSQRTEMLYNNERREQRLDEIERVNDITAKFNDRPDGKLITSVEQLTADPQSLVHCADECERKAGRVWLHR
jgi:hypothetical protein